MDTNYLENNYLTLVGKVTGEKEFSHEIYGERFYIFKLGIPRLSGNEDIIPITISERLIGEDTLKERKKLLVKGQFRSYNSYENERNKLILTVFARNIEPCIEKSKNPNEIFLDGYICKEPVYRKTPFGREISDILLAVNRAYNKSDYIPCIAWGRNARYLSGLSVGENIKIWGRMQSRTYQKKNGDEIEERVAYEVSISKIEVAVDRKEKSMGNGSL